MDEKDLMIPLELGYVQEAERKTPVMEVIHFRVLTSVLGHKCTTRLFFFPERPCYCFLLLKQVAKRNKNQISGRAVTGRGGLLRPLWQETQAVPRCDEGTTAPQRRSVVYPCDTEAEVTRHTDEQFGTDVGVHVGSMVYDLSQRDIFAPTCDTAHLHCLNKCFCIRSCCLCYRSSCTPPPPCFP